VTAELRVLVNLTWLVPGVVGGSEESTTDALRAVLGHRHDIQLTLAVNSGFPAAHPDLAESCRCEVLDSTGANRAARVLAEQTWLAGRTTELAPDVVHHAGGVVPLRHPGRCVVTIHDLQPLDEPANFSLVKRTYLRAMLGRSARAAEVVCVPSHFTASRVTELLGVPADAVHVVPWSVVSLDSLPAGTSGSGDSDGTGPGDSARPPGGGTDGPLFVYPAITYPHKNHLLLLEAFAVLSSEDPTARLVLAGGEGPCETAVRERIARPDLRGSVERPGRVGRVEMERLYRTATGVVVPSRYEGFGLPALEAMSRGVPLLVSNAGSLPEVVATAEGFATPVDPLPPDDPEAWARAMVVLAGLDEPARRSVAEAERSAADSFTPRRTADALAAAYHRAASYSAGDAS